MSHIPVAALRANQSEKDLLTYALTEEAFNSSSISLLEKIEAFPRFTTKRALARFLAKQAIYQQIIPVTGAVVECGVFNGFGLFTWAQLANIFEPTNFTRKIIGFDTFEGFPSVSEQDNTGTLQSKKGDLRGSKLDEIKMSEEKYNSERHLSHISNIDFVQGDFNITSEQYLEDNQHLIVSLLYLDFDIYEPTKKALEVFLPRMPKGAIVAFDEINCDAFPGETLALHEVLGIGTREIRRFPFDPWISYFIL